MINTNHYNQNLKYKDNKFKFWKVNVQIKVKRLKYKEQKSLHLLQNWVKLKIIKQKKNNKKKELYNYILNYHLYNQELLDQLQQ